MTVVLLLDVYTELVIDVFYIFNSTVIDWTCYFHLHLVRWGVPVLKITGFIIHNFLRCIAATDCFLPWKPYALGMVRTRHRTKGCVQVCRFVCFWRDNPQWTTASSFTRFLNHTRRTAVSRTPLDEWSARRRDLYLTTHNKHPCPRLDSNPQSQQASGRRPTP